MDDVDISMIVSNAKLESSAILVHTCVRCGTCTAVGVEAQRVIRIILACLSQNSWQSADTVTFSAQASTFIQYSPNPPFL